MTWIDQVLKTETPGSLDLLPHALPYKFIFQENSRLASGLTDPFAKLAHQMRELLAFLDYVSNSPTVGQFPA